MSVSKINIFCQGIKYLHTCLKSDIKNHVGRNRLKTTPIQSKQLLKDVLEIKRKKVDLNTESAKFFGVTSGKDIIGQIFNHGCLSYMKSNEHKIIQSFPNMECVNFENPQRLKAIKDLIWKDRKIEKLFEQGAAKLSFSAKIFGEKEDNIRHSIGIVADKNTQNIYILDSLSEFTQPMHNYRQKIKFLFTNPDGTSSPNLIFSTKPQQTLKEFTCNNWTYANIEAVQNALAKGQTITDTKTLNKILPDNINAILDDQMQYVIDNKDNFMKTLHKSSFKLSDFSRQ